MSPRILVSYRAGMSSFRKQTDHRDPGASAKAVAVIGPVIVSVIATLDVAALVSGNETVSVIDTVGGRGSMNRRASGSGACSAIRRSHPVVASALTESITTTEQLRSWVTDRSLYIGNTRQVDLGG